MEMRECCTTNTPCGLGQGDCDSDTECTGDLMCGKNNCGPEFLWSDADCCKLSQGNWLKNQHHVYGRLICVKELM